MTKTDTDAVERLMDTLGYGCEAFHSKDCTIQRTQAVFTLRALLTAKEAAEAKQSNLLKMLDDYVERKRAWREQAEALEAKLAVAVETLDAIASCQSYVKNDCPSLARATLAQINKETEDG